MAPDVRIDAPQIREVLQADVLKREVLEGEKAEAAAKQVARAAGRALRESKAKKEARAGGAGTTDGAAIRMK